MSPYLILPGSEHFDSAQSLLRLANASSTMHEHDEQIMSQLPGVWYTIFTDIPLRSTMPFSEVVNDEDCKLGSTVEIVGLLQQTGKVNKDTNHGTFNTSILFKLTGSEDIFTHSIEGTYKQADTAAAKDTNKKRLTLNFISSHLSTWDPDNREAKLHKLAQMTDLTPEPRETLISPPVEPGWITTTFLSDDGDLRVAKTNQNYTFVMKKIMLAEDDVDKRPPTDNNSNDEKTIKEMIHNEINASSHESKWSE